MAEGGDSIGDVQTDGVGDLLSQFRCLGTTDREVLVNDLHSILGGRVSREQCLFVLEMSSWNLQNAIGVYYDYLNQPSLLQMKLEKAFIDPPTPLTTGKQFCHVWTVINSGSITWPSGVRLVFTKGHKFEGILEGPLEALKPFETRNITVSLQSPSVSGVYSASWRLCDLEGRFFGESLELNVRVDELEYMAALTDQLAVMDTGDSNEISSNNERTNCMN